MSESREARRKKGRAKSGSEWSPVATKGNFNLEVIIGPFPIPKEERRPDRPSEMFCIGILQLPDSGDNVSMNFAKFEDLAQFCREMSPREISVFCKESGVANFIRGVLQGVAAGHSSPLVVH